jgi:hypothetical protein
VSAPEYCDTCGSAFRQVECWNCGGEGFSHHDCGEDSCCCLDPEDDVECDICAGNGHYDVCACGVDPDHDELLVAPQ